MKRPYRRRIIFGKFPNRFSGRSVNYFLILFLFLGAALFVPLIVQMELETVSQPTKEQAMSQFIGLHSLVWPPVFVTFVLLFIGSVIFTHRIAGPLYRLRCIFKAIGEGDLCVRATIRKCDYLHTEADSVNEMIESLRSKVKGIEEQYAETQKAVADLTEAGESSSSSDFTEHLQRLEVQMDRLRERLVQFRTVSGEGWEKKG